MVIIIAAIYNKILLTYFYIRNIYIINYVNYFMAIDTIRMIIKHNDWTTKTDYTNIKLKHINITPINLNGIINSYTLLYIKGKKPEKLKFFKEIKLPNNQFKLSNIKFYDNYIEFMAPSEDSIHGYIDSFKPFYFSSYIYYGIEDWIVTYENVSDIINELKNNINNSGKIIKIEKIKSDTMFIPMDFLYSKKEASILNYATYHGFYENPKKIKLHEIAEKFNVSDAYASKILRLSLNKLMYSVFK